MYLDNERLSRRCLWCDMNMFLLLVTTSPPLTLLCSCWPVIILYVYLLALSLCRWSDERISILLPFLNLNGIVVVLYPVWSWFCVDQLAGPFAEPAVTTRMGMLLRRKRWKYSFFMLASSTFYRYAYWTWIFPWQWEIPCCWEVVVYLVGWAGTVDSRGRCNL